MSVMVSEVRLREASVAACTKGASMAEGHLMTPDLNRRLCFLDLELLVDLLDQSGFHHLGYGIDSTEEGKQFFGFGIGYWIPSGYGDFRETHYWSDIHLDPLMIELCERLVIWDEALMGKRLPYRRCGRDEDDEQTWTISREDLRRLAAKLEPTIYPTTETQPPLFRATGKKASR